MMSDTVSPLVRDLEIEKARLKTLMEELREENEALKERLRTWEPKPWPPKGERGGVYPEVTKKGKKA